MKLPYLLHAVSLAAVWLPLAVLAQSTGTPIKGLSVDAVPRAAGGNAGIIALCIGNNAYQRTEDQLDTPINDAMLMKQTLERLPGGAEVLMVTDGTKETMEIQLNAFKAKTKVREYKLAFFYYSGHGVEDQPTGYDRPETFLLPTDAIIEDVEQLSTRAVPLSSILQRLNDMRTTVRAVILDCCRTGAPKATGALMGSTKNFNGFDERVKSALGKAVVPEATLIAFAASPGRRAAAFLKESDSNSPFTTFLSQQLATGMGNLRDLVEAAAETTEVRTERRQVPYVNYNGAASSIRQITFRKEPGMPPPVVVVPPSMPTPAPAPAPAPGWTPSGTGPVNMEQRPAGWQNPVAAKSPELIKALADLAALDVLMTTERARYKQALAVINRHTYNKTRGVQEGSAAYHECVAASNIINTIDATAPSRITDRARLEATVRALGGDPSVILAAPPSPATPNK